MDYPHTHRHPYLLFVLHHLGRHQHRHSHHLGQYHRYNHFHRGQALLAVQSQGTHHRYSRHHRCHHQPAKDYILLHQPNVTLKSECLDTGQLRYQPNQTPNMYRRHHQGLHPNPCNHRGLHQEQVLKPNRFPHADSHHHHPQ